MSDEPVVPDTSPTEMSHVHRFMVGDNVQYTTDGHDDLVLNTEGVVTGFANEELTYLDVDFDGTTHTVTEDELRHLPPSPPGP